MGEISTGRRESQRMVENAEELELRKMDGALWTLCGRPGFNSPAGRSQMSE